jgi:hypothetical protein
MICAASVAADVVATTDEIAAAAAAAAAAASHGHCSVTGWSIYSETLKGRSQEYVVTKSTIGMSNKYEQSLKFEVCINSTATATSPL